MNTGQLIEELRLSFREAGPIYGTERFYAALDSVASQLERAEEIEKAARAVSDKGWFQIRSDIAAKMLHDALSFPESPQGEEG